MDINKIKERFNLMFPLSFLNDISLTEKVYTRGVQESTYIRPATIEESIIINKIDYLLNSND